VSYSDRTFASHFGQTHYLTNLAIRVKVPQNFPKSFLPSSLLLWN